MAAASPTGCVAGEWFGGGISPQNDGLRWSKAGDSAILIDAFSAAAASAGFSYFTSYPAPEAPLTGTTITNASPAVASVVNTFSDGDQVVIYNAVGMQQISSMVFTISNVTGANFELAGLDASGFVNPATAFTVRRIAPFPRVAPPFYYVTDITQDTQAVVTTSQVNTYVVGQTVEFTIPSSFGMVQLNNNNQPQNRPPMITEVIDDYSFKINVDTSGFSPFVFPLSTQSPTAQLFATVAPAGQRATLNPITGVQTGYNFQQVPFHSGAFVPYMYLPAGVDSPGGEDDDVIVWQAYKMETGTINSLIPS